MAKFKGVTYCDGGADLLRTRAATAGRIVVHLVSTYAAGDSYATVLANSLGSVALTAGSIVSSGASGASRVDTFSFGSFTLTGGASGTPNLHFVVADTGSNEVHWATDENTNLVSVAAGGTCGAGSFTQTQTLPPA